MSAGKHVFAAGPTGEAFVGKRWFARRSARLVVLVVVIGGVAAGVAYATGAIPGSDGVIHGCYDSGGNVKVESTATCPRGYTALPWNQTGPAGAQGPAGPAGAAGPQGADGPVGPTGATGPAGPKGDTGDPGTNGIPGVGQFTPTQIVEGGILTCTTTSVSEGQPRCDGPMLNGMKLANSADAALKICAAVIGHSVGATFGGSGSELVPSFDWNGSKWVLRPDNGLGLMTLVICS